MSIAKRMLEEQMDKDEAEAEAEEDALYGDPTEATRRAMIKEQQTIGPLNRADLAMVHGDVYDTAEMTAKFRVKHFLAPFVVVERLLDNKLGTLEFQHEPRFYYGWQPDREE